MKHVGRIIGLVGLVALSLGSLHHAARAAPTPTKVAGLRPGYHDGKAGSEFYFEVPTHMAVHLSPGDLLEPESELSQRVVYYGGGIGFCIDPDISAGTISTVYRFRGRTSERALERARSAAERGVRRDEAIWAEMRRRPEPRRMNYSRH
jgi:hypothetical protein